MLSMLSSLHRTFRQKPKRRCAQKKHLLPSCNLKIVAEPWRTSCSKDGRNDSQLHHICYFARLSNLSGATAAVSRTSGKSGAFNCVQIKYIRSCNKIHHCSRSHDAYFFTDQFDRTVKLLVKEIIQ